MEFAYSSSSSSSSSFLKSEPHFIYDVFIKFWGEDIGKKFVSHLHSVLLQEQVKTLINEETLQEGMKFAEHMRAIAASKIVIIVFTKTDAKSSSRCILEVEKILEYHQTFGQIVLSVFYEIDPLDVRFQKDGLGIALAKAALISSGKELEYWWCRQPAGIFGWDVRDFRHDAELVKVIVSHVQTLLGYADMSIPRFALGLESQVEKVIDCIENHSTDVCVIGIWGTGASGKTILAEAIYNRIYRSFIGKSFIQNIRDFWNKENGTYVQLQESLLYDVLKSKFKVESYLMGRTVIENELSRRKLLIVLDGVNEFCQLENLCGNSKWFGQGTVIIITTRDVGLLLQFQVNYVYKMHYNRNDSFELLSCFAF
ncbi:Disease resistance protein [Vigna angularis]|nr:Disease resistance protein [Vigna angularis]